jgi:hypothetical protein
MPPEAVDLVSRLLQYSPNLRCTAVSGNTHDTRPVPSISVLYLREEQRVETCVNLLSRWMHLFTHFLTRFETPTPAFQMADFCHPSSTSSLMVSFTHIAQVATKQCSSCLKV